jgi:hypothetical protein
VVTLHTRRIATSVCALCLAIPASAGASPATNPSGVKGPFGNPPTGPTSTVRAKGAFGSAATGPPSTVKVKGPFGKPPSGPRRPVKVKGPYGISPRTGAQNATAASVRGGGASRHDGANGWRTAAISEAALLAAVVLGLALLLAPARRRVPRIVT